MKLYVDTSAAAKLLVAEVESRALAAYLDESADDPVSSALLETELRRMAVRLDLSQSSVTDLVERIELVEPGRSIFSEAGLLPGKHLRSLDALHLATALRIDAVAILSYDARLSAAAHAFGLEVVAPA